MTLRSKVFLLSAGLIVGPLTLAYFLVRDQLIEAGERQARTNLAATSSAFARLTDRQDQRLLNEASLIARLPEVGDGLRLQGDLAQTRAHVMAIVSGHVELFALFNSQGEAVLREGELSRLVLQKATGAAPLASALQGQAAIGLWLIEDHLYKLAAQPVLDGVNQLQIGTLLIGQRIRGEAAQRFSEAEHSEVMVLADGSIIGSSLTPDQSSELKRLYPEIVSGTLKRFNLGEETFLVRTESVRVDYGGSRCDHLLLESLASTDAFAQTLMSTFGALGVVTLLGALALAWAGSRRLTSPLLDSAAKMAEMARTGELDLPEISPAEPEVAAFHDTFRSLILSIKASQREQERSYIEAVGALVIAIDARDNDTTGHSFRVARYAERLGRELELRGEQLRALEWGALLHDIGKIAVPDAILRKAGPLTTEEWHIMHQHPTWGVEMLADVSFLRPALEIIQCHQERWDGMGYPAGLAGEEIPRGARLFAVIDAYDAITSDRPYRRAASHQQALSELQRVSGTQLDPTIVEAFFRLPFEDLDEIRQQRRADLDLSPPAG